MKYVCDHSTTREALQSWAGSQKLITASYFFWNSGLPMQKSQIGLLRSLLYQILLECPSLIPETCSAHRSKGTWGREELRKALDEISKQTFLPAKFCFFVDGLDEYEGDNEKIIHLLQDLAASPSIKICVSSRPWNAFLDAFDNNKCKLVLEDLTKNDMREYVQNMLAENEVFAKAAKQDSRCNDLVPKIAEKAHGVWLWVYLVVRDLLRDLKGEEEYPFLQRRLDSFPDELEKYFENILGRIDRIHREETAKIFLIAVESVRPLPVLAFKYLIMEQDDPNYSIKSAIEPISPDEVNESFRRWRKRLNSRCRDLLEINTTDSDDTFLKYKVDFLHQTVRDFLRDNYPEELRKHTADRFDARASLCKILLALIKALPVPADFRSLLNELFGLVDKLLYYAREMERNSGISNIVLLDELDRVNTIHAENAKTHSHWTNARDSPTPSDSFQEYGQCTYLALSIQARLRLYVDEKLQANPGLLVEKRGRPLLDYALRPKRVTPAALPYQQQYQDTSIDVQIVSSLLSRGSDPNQSIHIYHGQTVWGLFLLSCYMNADRHLQDTWYDTVELLIDHGADPNIQVKNPADPQVKKIGTTARYKQDVVVDAVSRYLTVSDILNSVFPRDKAGRLQVRMAEVAQQQQSPSSIVWRMFRWIELSVFGVRSTNANF
jgi:hypothetical protein